MINLHDLAVQLDTIARRCEHVSSESLQSLQQETAFASMTEDMSEHVQERLAQLRSQLSVLSDRLAHEKERAMFAITLLRQTAMKSDLAHLRSSAARIQYERYVTPRFFSVLMDDVLSDMS